MSFGKGGGDQKTTQTNEPWKEAQPYLKGGLADLSKWYASDYGRNYYPGSTVVPFNPMSEQAFGMTANRALEGSGVNRAASGNIESTLRGDFLNPQSNPWLSNTFDLAAGKVRSSIDSQFNRGGTYGGSLHEGAMADNLGDLATKIYGGNYAQERGNQMNALGMAPGIANQDYYDADRLAGVGNQYEQQAGRYVTDDMNRYNFYQNAPLQRLQQFFGMVNPVANQGGTQTGMTPSNSNGLSQTLGSAASLASILDSAGLFAAMSDPDMKTDIRDLSDDEVLEKSARVPAKEYRYKDELGPKFGGLKVGPMADDFAREFGGDGHTIPMPKLMGVLWAQHNAIANKLKKMEAA